MPFAGQMLSLQLLLTQPHFMQLHRPLAVRFHVGLPKPSSKLLLYLKKPYHRALATPDEVLKLVEKDWLYTTPEYPFDQEQEAVRFHLPRLVCPERLIKVDPKP